MIIKKFTGTSNPQDAQRRRSRIALAVFALGVIGTVCSRTILSESVMPDFAHGFYSGFSFGLILLGALLFVRARYLMAHPEKARAQLVKERDEREQLIAQKAMSTGGLITFFLLAAALFISAPISMAVFQTLFVVFTASVVILVVTRAVYACKL